MMPRISKSMGFLGDQVVEFFFGNNSVTVSIGSLDHFLENGIVSELSEILGNFSEIFQSDKS